MTVTTDVAILRFVIFVIHEDILVFTQFEQSKSEVLVVVVVYIHTYNKFSIKYVCPAEEKGALAV